MPVKTKILLFIIITILPFIAGARINKMLSDPRQTAKILININLFFLEPIILLWTIWGLRLSSQMLILPLAGVLTVITGFIFGICCLPLLKLNNISKVSFLITSSLANQGMTMGGFLCYLISGEEGLALASIYIVYYLPFIFTIVFPFAKISSVRVSKKTVVASPFFLKQLKTVFLNFQNLPLAGILIAFFLHFSGIERPLIPFPLETILGIAISIYYFTLGINFKPGDLTSFLSELTAISLIKFILIPAITFIILQISDLNHNIETVIMLQSFAPVAIYSVISSILFDLDSRMTSGIFVMNSLIFIFTIMPILILFNKMLINQ